MAFDFQGQVAVITGAGEGIGLEVARQLSANGARVVLNDIDPDKANAAAALVSEAGNECLALPGDVGDTAILRGLVDLAVEKFGRVDMAIANAGITIWNDFLDYQEEDFYKVISVNLGGSFFLTQAAARQMIKQGEGGRVLLMSSVTGHRALPYLSAYSMTKAGLEGLARNLVAELAPHGITVNAIAPGATETPRNLEDDPQYNKVWGGLTPTKRTGKPADIANTALYFLSPATGQVTGQTIIVDGGWSNISPTPALDFVDEKKPSADS